MVWRIKWTIHIRYTIGEVELQVSPCVRCSTMTELGFPEKDESGADTTLPVIWPSQQVLFYRSLGPPEENRGACRGGIPRQIAEVLKEQREFFS